MLENILIRELTYSYLFILPMGVVDVLSLSRVLFEQLGPAIGGSSSWLASETSGDVRLSIVIVLQTEADDEGLLGGLLEFFFVAVYVL